MIVNKLEKLIEEFDSYESKLSESTEPESFEDTRDFLDKALYSMKSFFDSTDKNKFFCEGCCEYKEVKDRDSRVQDEDGVLIYCHSCCEEYIMEMELE